METASATASAAETERTVFARKTSGLVKDLGAFESFSINLISLGPGPAFGLFLIILLFVTGANLMQASILAALIAVPIIVTYTLIGIEMPRSGGEYVYASRQLHPYFGVLSAFGRLLNVIIYAAVLPYWFSTLSVGPGVAVWGALTSSSKLLSDGNSISIAIGNPLYITIIGILVTLVAMALWIVMKPRAAFQVFSGLLILELIGIIVSVGLLLAMGHTGFVNAVNSAAGYPTYYQTVAAYGATSPLGPYGSSVTNTLLFVPLLFAFYYMFGTAPSYIAGEFKRSTRSISMGMAISFLLSILFAVLIIWTFEQVVGMNFLNGSVAQTDYGYVVPGLPASATLPFAMGLTTAPALAAHANSIVLAFIMLSSATWYLLWLILGFYIFSRFMLSMSLDRLVPKFLGNVTRSTHQPWVGVLVIGVAGIILLPILAYNYLALYTPMVFLLFFLPMVTVMLTSLSLARLGMRNRKALHVIAGLASFVVTLVSAYLVATLPLLGAAAGFTASNKETGAIVIAAVFIGAGILYLASRAYNSRTRGIDIGLAFKELPPD